MKTNQASAVWQGKLKDGKGQVTIPSMGQEVSYSYSSRFGEDRGTNPEELIAAAHAQCFSMALADYLAAEGYDPQKVVTEAHVVLERKNGHTGISRSELVCEAAVPEISEDSFRKLAEEARKNCTVSRALSQVEITLDVRLSN